MFGRKNHGLIDAGSELKELKDIDGERGASKLGSQRRSLPPGTKIFLLVILVCAGIVGAFFTYKAMQVREAVKTKPIKEVSASAVKNTLPELKLATPEVQQKTANPPEKSASPQQNKETSLEEDDPDASLLLRQRRLNAALTEENQDRNNRQASSPKPSNQTSENMTTGADGELQNKLKPLRLNASQAGLLGDRDMLLTQGAMIDCQLETSMVTSQPGMTSCNVTRDVYSTSGRVVLIDRGSKIVGNYQSGLQQGQTRIFVLWSRIETPTGVMIHLDSPGTGSLGEAGVGGTIDTHFGERFGSAILFSLIGDFGNWVSEQGSGDRNSIQFNNTSQGTQQTVTEILKYSMSIPPTLYKNQGDRISIFVARDLDFGGVYALKPN